MSKIRVKNIREELLISVDNKNVNFYNKENSNWYAKDGLIIFKYNDEVLISEPTQNFIDPNENSVIDLLLLLNNMLTSYGVDDTNLTFVKTKSDFPIPVNNEIRLIDNHTYYILSDIDLSGDRLISGQDTVIIGSSSENSSLTSTGLTTKYLITTHYTMPLRHITIKDVTYGISVNPGNTATTNIALDWTGVNFSGCTINILLGDIDNFILTDSAVLGSGTIKITGTVETIAINNSLFTGDGTAYNIIDITSTSTITRRFRIIYSSIVAFGSTVGINVDVSATIPTESYILDTVNFSGGGTYLSGVLYTDNKARFVNCKGIENTAEIGNYYMFNNATSTVISIINTPVKIAGVTSPNSINQKFSHTDNRITYTGSLSRDFQISANASFTAGNNEIIGLYVAKNGTVISSSEMYATTSGVGKAESISCHTVVELIENDYIEMWIENSSGTTNITAEYLNVIAKSLN